MEAINKLAEAYDRLTRVHNVAKWFETSKEFKDWLRLGNVEDMKACLKAFEKAELYEHCAIIKRVIEQEEKKITPYLELV